MDGVLGYEGHETLDHRIIEHGALTWARRPLPLLAMPTASGLPARAVGVVTYIRRSPVGTGAILATGRLYDGSSYVRGMQLALAMDARIDATSHMDDGRLVILDAAIYAATLTYRPAWRTARLVVQ